MTFPQLQLVGALTLVFAAIGVFLRARRLPMKPSSRNARASVFARLLFAAVLIGVAVWSQRIDDAIAASDRRNGLPSPAPLLADSRMLVLNGFYVALLVGAAGFCMAQLVLFLRQRRQAGRQSDSPAVGA